MKKTLCLILLISNILFLSSSKVIDKKIENKHNKSFCIDELAINEKKFKTIPVETCGVGSVKTYMDYRAITNTASKQYKHIKEHMKVDNETGFLYDEDGFIGAALGLFYGDIGDRYYFTLENGVILPIVKIDSKASVDTDPSLCFNPNDNSIIEFVIDAHVANEYFGQYGNGLVLSGNYGNYALFKGAIASVEKVLDEKIVEDDGLITYSLQENDLNNNNIFYYASGY